MRVSKSLIKKLTFITLSLFVILLIKVCSSEFYNKSTAYQENVFAQKNERLLTFYVEADSDTGITSYFSQELNGNFRQGLEYRHINSVTIKVDDTMIPLEDALRDNVVSETDILSYALQDAQHGICEMSYESYHGLNHFTFIYPECDVRIIYDVLETPSGGQHFISQLIFYDSDISLLSPSLNFYDEATGELLVQEDWGLSFEVTQVENTGMTIQCKQSGGMQIGQLRATAYFLTGQDSILQRVDDTNGEMPHLDILLDTDADTMLTFDWLDVYGALPRGEYKIGIAINDIYNKEDVHPLMQNFHDQQNYYISFTIP